MIPTSGEVILSGDNERRTDYYEENPETIKNSLKLIFNEIGFSAETRNICINNCYKKSSDYTESVIDRWENLDCEYGRIITSKGVYACPFLANDHRGRCGTDFKDFSLKSVLETSYCNTCFQNKKQVFGIDFSKFNC